ncbi:putative triacylglycerol lipase [Naviculisporaceae sp. PSN 640]
MAARSIFVSVWQILVHIALFWYNKLLQWYHKRSPIEVWLDVLRNASEFEEWEQAALHLDALLGLDLWRNNATSQHYDYRLINERLASIEVSREVGDVHALVNLLRSGLVRNLGNITAPKLYNRSFAGTKFLIEEYITQVAEAIEDIACLPTAGANSGTTGGRGHALNKILTGGGPTSVPNQLAVNFAETGSGDSIGGGGFDVTASRTNVMTSMSNQMKLDFVHDTRQAFGRSTLVLQGGAIFGLCHLGVVKALFLRGLLPRIITGTATGALIAALVSIHTEEELPRVLSGDGIDLSAFSGRGRKHSPGEKLREDSLWTRLSTLMRRVRRFRRDGYFLDVKVLEDCVRTNVGDLTFEEAYQRSKRILNITVATAGQGGVPTLLNYLTAPNVLVWTAAVASNATTPSLYGHRETRVLCKDSHGNIIPWKPANTVDFRHWTHVSYSDREAPLLRIAELFNVNHFIVSQARPYLIPFLQSDMHGPSLVETRNKTTQMTAFLVRMMGLEIRHRLRQLDTLQLLPAGIRRFLVDERIPGASMTLVPEVTIGDFVRLLETPTKETLEYWILRGERSVWPAVAALRIRCAVETELDRAYQQVRRLKAGGLRRKASSMNTATATAGAAESNSNSNSNGNSREKESSAESSSTRSGSGSTRNRAQSEQRESKFTGSSIAGPSSAAAGT